jgi:hypothetical protein
VVLVRHVFFGSGWLTLEVHLLLEMVSKVEGLGQWVGATVRQHLCDCGGDIVVAFHAEKSWASFAARGK